jgi:hypothetical protein
MGRTCVRVQAQPKKLGGGWYQKVVKESKFRESP